jgi:branched-chain amino acid transport system ATP-binding protein
MSSEMLLEVREVFAGYGDGDVLRGVNLDVRAGEVVSVLGSNGVGKSTLNRAISGVVRTRAGSIRFDGAPIEREPPASIVTRGLIHVPEGRRLFPNLSVDDNLDLGSYRRAGARRSENRDRVFAIFPRLRDRCAQRAGTLSGGEQ